MRRSRRGRIAGARHADPDRSHIAVELGDMGRRAKPAAPLRSRRQGAAVQSDDISKLNCHNYI
jgi:hypothetical protein